MPNHTHHHESGQFDETGSDRRHRRAGFSGIAAAAELQRAGISFAVYEKSGGPGGVWWDNVYPGAAVDTPIHLYSYSFRQNDWTRNYATRDELQRYLSETIDDLGMRSAFRFNEAVTNVTWIEGNGRWLVESERDAVEYDFVVSAVGILNVPKIPKWPGMEDFAGLSFHSSQWPVSMDALRGKSVGVVGTGSSAAQIISELGATAGHLYVFQREPAWVNPKPIKVYGEEERRELVRPGRYLRERRHALRIAAEGRRGRSLHIPGSRANVAAMARCLAYIDDVFRDRPDLKKLVTPTHAYFGKRPLRDSNFYPTLLRNNVTLVPGGISEMQQGGAVDARGVLHELDALVLATGFQPSTYLAGFEVRGSDGIGLHEYWAGEPRAFLGMSVPGFPNFYMMYGPNTNQPILIPVLEEQAKLIVRGIQRVRHHGGSGVSLEVRRRPFKLFDEWVQRELRGSVWYETNNYFKTSSGRIVTQWPSDPRILWWMTRLSGPAYRIHRRQRPLARRSGARSNTSAQEGDAMNAITTSDLPAGSSPVRSAARLSAPTEPIDGREVEFSFTGVQKDFLDAQGNPFVAVHDIELDVALGSFVAIIGPSGCGKSTLLNMAAGLMDPTGGTVSQQGKKVREANPSVGYLTQQDNLLPWRTVEQNVALALEIKGVPRRERLERVAQVLRVVGLEGVRQRFPSQLSGGMQKRVAIARTLVYEPTTLLMDEPFGSVDAQTRLLLQRELLDLWERDQKTIMFVTHDLEEAILLADRVVVFGRGPGTIVHVEDIRIPRPRDIVELRGTRAFSDTWSRLWSLLESQLR